MSYRGLTLGDVKSDSNDWIVFAEICVNGRHARLHLNLLPSDLSLVLINKTVNVIQNDHTDVQLWEDPPLTRVCHSGLLHFMKNVST